MSIEKCIAGRVAAGEITQDQADEALTLVRERREITGNRADSAEEAADLALLGSRMKERALEQRRQLSLQASKQIEVSGWVKQQPRGMFRNTPEAKTYYGTMSVLVPDKTGGAKHKSVEGMQLGYRRTLEGMFADGIEAMRSKMAGLKQQTPNMVDFIYEMFGVNRGNVSARAAADAWKKTTDWGADRWVALGGRLARKETWRQPQAHDPVRLTAAGKAQWTADIEQAVADGGIRFVDFQTGVPVTDARRAGILNEMYETITTEGANKIVPGQQSGVKLANKRDLQRSMEFATPDAWLAYHDKYGPGRGQIFDMLTAHIDGLAADIGQLDVLGPNPTHTVRVLVDQAKQAGVKPSDIHRLETVWTHVSGETNMPVSDTLARVFGETRSFLGAAQLGSALLSALGDPVMTGMTALYNGLPVWDTMTRYLKLLNPANAADRLTAWRLGLGAEAQTHRFQGAARHHLDMTRGVGGKLNEAVMRLSLLDTETSAATHAVGWEMLSTLADRAGRGFDALDPRLRGFMQRYGIDAAGWDAMRAHVTDMDGLPVLDPQWVLKQGGDAAEAALKLSQGIAVEQRTSLAMPGAFERSWMLGQSRPGTGIGEIMRSFWLYKSFPVSVLTGHVLRGMMQMRHEGKFWYLPGFLIATTLAGGLAMQLKAIAQGKDPRDPTSDPWFWTAAFIQGGGAGIAGDFLNGSTTARTGKDYVMTALGPVAALGSDALGLVPGNIGQLARGEDNTNFGREAAMFLKRYTPGTSLWYARLAIERWVWNTLQEWADPKYAESFRRTEANAFKQTGQRFWWRPGENAPYRAPEVSGR